MSVVGVSTGCYHGLDVVTEDAVRLAAGLGADAVEVYLQGDPELDPGIVREIAARCRETGVAVVSVHPYVFGWEHLLFTSYTRQRQWAWRRYAEYLDVCVELGAGCFVGHGPPAHHVRSPTGLAPGYVTATRTLAAEARERGIRFCLENVSYGLLRRPADFRELGELVEPELLGFVVDFKSAWKAAYRPADFMAGELAGLVHHTQVSFRQDGRYGLAAEDGPLDPDVAAAVAAADVPQILEIEPTGADQIGRSVRALRAAAESGRFTG